MCLFIKPKTSLCLFWEVFESSGQKLAFLKSLSLMVTHYTSECAHEQAGSLGSEDIIFQEWRSLEKLVAWTHVLLYILELSN